MAEPYTSPWWLVRLGQQLDGRARAMHILQDYYDGRQPLRMASDEFRKAFESRVRGWSDNFCALVVQAVEERLTVVGFRFGSDRGDRKAWGYWQSNLMDAQSQKAHREALIKGDCPVIVSPSTEGPLIRVQKPEEVVVAYDDDPLVRAVAMKRWKTLDERELATLYYPDRVEKYEKVKTTWAPRQVDGEPWPLPHSLGVVPVVTLVNDPDLDNVGSSEIANVLPLQDVLNKLFVDLMVASEYGAFRQRWATGLEIPLDPETKKPIEPFKASVERVWSTAVPDARFGDFEQTDLSGLISSIETTIQHIASKTRTPPHYLLGQSGAFPSGESLKATETGLVAKARRRMRDSGEAWEEVMRLAFRASGDRSRGSYLEAETVWRDPESRTEAEHVDALTKLKSIGVPDEQLWEDAGYTPTQIGRFKEMRGPVTETALTAEGVE